MLPPEGRDRRFHDDTCRREGRPQESRFDDSYCQRPLSFRPVCSPSAPRLGRERVQGRCDSLTDFSRRILGDRRTCSRAYPHRLAIRCPHGHPHLSLIHISEPTRLRRISYAVFCLKKKKVHQQKKIAYTSTYGLVSSRTNRTSSG